MKKWTILVGVLFILAGCIVLSVQGIANEQTVGNDVPYVAIDESWSTPPTYFKEREMLRVDFRVGPNWAYPPHETTTIDDIEFPRIKLVTIKVIDSNNSSDYTQFDVVLICPEEPYDPSRTSLHPKIRLMHHGPLIVGTYTENQTGTVKEFTEIIGGIVRRDGNYTVQIELYPDIIQNITPQNETEWIYPDPPANIYLYKVYIESAYPYRFLLAASPISISIGIATLVWGSKWKRPKYYKRKNF
jgi:hypothetical protein